MKLRESFSTLLVLAAFALSCLLFAPATVHARATKRVGPFLSDQQTVAVVKSDDAATFKLATANTLYAERESKTTIQTVGFARPPLVAVRMVQLPPVRAVSKFNAVSRARRLPLKLLINRFSGKTDPPLIC
jgi:hypothetical protein